MNRWLLAVFALVATVASAGRVTTFLLDNGTGWPAGTTVELCSNGTCATGLTGNQHVLDVPIQPGQAIDAKVRAVAPADYQCGDPPQPCPYSPWVTLVQTWPAVPVNPWARKQEIASMAAPTFVAEYATVFNTTTSPKTAMNAVAINSGDVLIGFVVNESQNSTLALTENGSSSWIALQELKTSNYCETRALQYTATAGETLTVTATSSTGFFGSNVIRFSGSDGVGASNIAQANSGSPSVSLTTTQANSAIVVIVSDWNAVSGTQTFTNNFSGTPTHLTDFPGNSNNYGIAIAYFPDAGAAGSKTVGMSAPTGQKWTIIAVEVKGTGGAAATGLPRRAIDGPLYGATRGSIR